MRALILLSCLLLQACVQPRVPEVGQASLKTWSDWVSVDGVVVSDPRSISLSPGQHEVVVSRRFLMTEYRCVFRLEARAGKNYEIVDQSNPEPLVLYEWSRGNALWSLRRSPQPPVECLPGPYSSGASAPE